jgi:hypothetical protein
MDDERGGGVNIGRRRLLLGAVAAPFVITTPGLLMPVRKRVILPGDEEFTLPLRHYRGAQE